LLQLASSEARNFCGRHVGVEPPAVSIIAALGVLLDDYVVRVEVG